MLRLLSEADAVRQRSSPLPSRGWLVPALVCLPALAACGAAKDANDAKPSECVDLSPARDTSLTALVIGEGDPTHFRPIAEGGTEELILGSQGGWMVTPVMRVDANELGTDGKCVHLHVDAEVEAREPVPFAFTTPESAPVDGYWYYGSLPLFLSRDLTSLTGKALTLTATFQDDGRAASAVLHVTLVNDY